MRVAVVIPRYGLIGGAEGFAYEVTERLAERDTLPIEVWKKKFDAEFLFYKKHYTKNHQGNKKGQSYPSPLADIHVESNVPLLH